MSEEGDTVIGVPKPRARRAIAESPDADTIIVSRPKRARRSKADAAPAAEPAAAPVALEAPEPPVARFAIRIGTHEPIPLDVPAYVGRRPSTPRITSARLPRLVMVPSPYREVSSTHVELHQEGETVVVTDLASTNGTTVTSPGLVPLGLRQGESVVVGAGTVVDIGDGIRILVVSASDDPKDGGS